MSIFCLQRQFMWCVKTNNLTKWQRKWCDRKCGKTTYNSANCRGGGQVTVKMVEKEVLLRENDAGNWTQTSVFLVIMDNWIYSLYAIRCVRNRNYMWLVKYHTLLCFSHIEHLNEDCKYMADLCNFDEAQCMWWLAYGVDERGSVPIIVGRNFSCSIRPFWVVTLSLQFSAYRCFFKGYISAESWS